MTGCGRVLLAALVLPWAGAAGCDPADGGTARVVLALAESSCSDFCASRVGASLYRAGAPVPLGPERTASCGEVLSFDGLPGGQRIVVEAWVGDAEGRRLLSGRSAEVTVAADEAVTVPVELAPAARPVLARATPSSLLPGPAGNEVLLEGEGLGTGQGLAAVELDGQPLAVVNGAWGDDAVRVRVHRGDGGTRVRVRNCGVASEALPLHVAADPPGSAVVQPLGCPSGATVHGAAPLPGTPDLLLALSCEGQGYVQRLQVAGCAFSATVQRDLAGVPRSLAAEDDGDAAWVVLGDEGAVVRVPLAGDGTPSAVSVPAPWVPRTVAWAGGLAWVLADDAGGGTALLGVRDDAATPLQDVPGSLRLRDLAGTPTRVLAAAATAGGEGRLVAVLPATGEVRLVPLDGCGDPLRVAAGEDGQWAAVACGGPAPIVAAVRLADGEVGTTVLPGDRPLNSLVLGRQGALALGWQAGEGGLVAVDLTAGTALGPWGPSRVAASVLALSAGLDTLLVAGDAGLQLLSPWSPADPCPPGGAP